MNIKNLAASVFLGSLLLVAGCSTPAPPYAVSIPNVQKIKDGGGTVGVSEFTAEGSDANNTSISIRTNPMVSPKGTFSSYLQDALVQELTEAKLFDAKSDVQISAVLLKNNISAAGLVTASAEIEARFVVKREGKVTFEKIKRATIEWDSNFIGAIAIPRAHQNYPRLVTTLLTQLYDDKDFLLSLKK